MNCFSVVLFVLSVCFIKYMFLLSCWVPRLFYWKTISFIYMFELPPWDYGSRATFCHFSILSFSETHMQFLKSKCSKRRAVRALLCSVDRDMDFENSSSASRWQSHLSHIEKSHRNVWSQIINISKVSMAQLKANEMQEFNVHYEGRGGCPPPERTHGE